MKQPNIEQSPVHGISHRDLDLSHLSTDENPIFRMVPSPIGRLVENLREH